MNYSDLLIPFELQLFAGGWQPPRGWEPQPRDDAPNREASPHWQEYVSCEYGRDRLEALLSRGPDHSARLETGLLLAYEEQERLSQLAARVIRGGMRDELCPVLVINLHLSRFASGTPLLARTSQCEVERISLWLMRDCGSAWVSARQMYKRIAVDLP